MTTYYLVTISQNQPHTVNSKYTSLLDLQYITIDIPTMEKLASV